MRNSQLAVVLAGLVVGGFALVNGAQAATCTATSAITNPDATLTNSNNCGVGILDDQNDSQADVQAVTGDPNWVLVGGVGAPPAYFSFTGAGGSSGQWFIDITAPTDTDFLIVIKNGGAGGNPSQAPPDTVFWTWFDVDTSIACANPLYDYCGTWTMYGEGGKIKNLSHLSLYAQEGDDRLVPEPATIVLIGGALLALGLSRRRRA